MDAPERRTRAAQERLRAGGGDALVCFPGRNFQYLTGFHEEPGERHLLLFVPASGDPVAYAPELYAQQLREGTWLSESAIQTWADGADPVAGIERIVDDLGLAGGRLLVDDAMWARFTLDLRAAAPDATLGLASEVLSGLRVRKDDAELDALQRAAGVADDVLDAVRALGAEAVGLTERELARRIRRLLEDGGGAGVSFEPVVAAGPNGAKPHHRHGDREIRPGDPVVLDFGTRVDGYPSDVTRTLVFGGDPPDGFREVHRVVREAQAAGVDAVAPGVAAESVDRAARDVIEAAGYGDEFVHRTGHGVGLDVHEPPWITDGNDRELEPGMVFSVEPGVYLPGEFGVRIEDLVVVTADGCRRLNRTDRGWAV